jgi:hypothetical protein
MKIIVGYLGQKSEHTIKFVKGKDFVFEAAKKEMEKFKFESGDVSVVLRCHRKWFPRKICLYNTYFVLMAVGMRTEAERLRHRFLDICGIDVSQEPLCDLI